MALIQGFFRNVKGDSFKFKEPKCLHVMLRQERVFFCVWSNKGLTAPPHQAPLTPGFKVVIPTGGGVLGGEREEEGSVKIKRRNNGCESGPQFCKER